MLALEGYRMLDLSRLLPGPFCSMLLADMGMDVIKVEAPRTGDYIRWWPPLLGKNSGFHVVLNRNKRSLTLNLKEKEGREIFLDLAKNADVVLESFRPGVMDRLGLGYDALEAVNPRLIYCAITGFGQDGPLAQRAGHDLNYLALNGVLSYGGLPGRPVLPGVQVADLGGGALPAALGITAALLARERTGKGQFIDISMADNALAWNCMRWGKFLADGQVPAPGDDLLNHGFACYNLYEARDGRYMALGAIEPQFWKEFCRSVNRPRWDRPDYFDPGPHQKDLRDEIASLFKERDQAEWIEHFSKLDCCCEPVLDLDEVMESPQMKSRGMVVDLVHEAWGAYRQLGIGPKLSRTPGSLRSHAPDLGEHTDAVLSELGYSAEAVEDLRSREIV